jgi:hypothetical protein
MPSSLEIIREPITLISDPSGTPLYYHFAAGAVLKCVQERFDVPHDGSVLATRNMNQTFELSGKLIGEFENISTLFPHLAANLGTRLIGASDTPWHAITPSGRKWVFHRATITKRPGLMAKTGDTLLSDFTLTAVYSPTQSGWFTHTTGQTHPGYSSIGISSILTLAPTVSFGSDPYDNLWPVDGAEFAFDWELEPVRSNNLVIDWTIKSQTHTAKIKPQTDATWAEWMTKIGADVAMGAAVPVADVIASYTGFYARLYNAEAQIDSFTFSHDNNFVSGITATARQRYASGAAVALSYVGTSAPA